jgi:hypothetical protein
MPFVLLLLLVAGRCHAELPSFYKTATRVTWIVENIDKVRPAWEALGLSGIREYPNVRLMGQFRGKPVDIIVWQISGQLGNVRVDMIQPGEGQSNAFTRFLSQHGDGIFSVVHDVPNRNALDQEVRRMQSKGVSILQQVTMKREQGPETYTWFDTERNGKVTLGLVVGTTAAAPPDSKAPISHFAPVIFDTGEVSTYWTKLGFPPIAFTRTGDLAVGYQRHALPFYQWIAAPPAPSTVYADFLRKHNKEGIGHIGMMVQDLDASIAAYQKLGFKVSQSGNWDFGNGAARYAHLDTNKTGGIALQLVQKK